MDVTPTQRTTELDGIRGIACLMVLLDHVILSELTNIYIPGVSRLLPWLIGGVDLFFVLSGFLIGGILLDHRPASNRFRVFWIRRIARIMPVYYLLMATFFAALLIKPAVHAPWLDLWLFKDVMPLWTYPLFVQNVAQSMDGGDGGARWVASTWSLAIEEQFYLLLPPILYCLNRRSAGIFAVLCVVAAPFVRAQLWQTSGSWFTAYFLLPGRADALAWGVLAAFIVRNPAVLALVRRSRIVLDLLAVSATLMLTAHGLEFLSDILPERVRLLVKSLDFSFRAAIFAYAILRVFVVAPESAYRRILGARALVFVGGISYALYMYHPAINGLLHGFIFADEPRIPDMAHFMVALTVIVVSIGAAWLSTTYFELPLRRLSHRVKYRFRQQPRGRDAWDGSPRTTGVRPVVEAL